METRLLFQDRPSQASSRGCQSQDCERPTREGKPYCIEHVTHHPYVQSIMDALAERRAEEERVRRKGLAAVDLEGPTARELLIHLSLHGSRTLERLCRELQIDLDVVEHYVRVFVNRSLVALSQTNRGSTVVSPANANAA